MDEDDIKSLIGLKDKRDSSYIRVIIHIGEKELNIKKLKFLVKRDVLFSNVVYTIRKRIKLTDEKAIFLFINNYLVPSSYSLGQIYDNYGNKEYTSIILNLKLENTFGSL